MKTLIFGGTGFLGQALSKRLLAEGSVCVFSRSEDKHRKIRSENPTIKSIIGDVRDYRACLDAIRSYNPDVIIAAQALKQIDLCEQMPFETVQTNILGAQNIVNAVKEYLPFHGGPDGKLKFLSISTDKSCAPSTLYGATKLIQERLHLALQHVAVANNACRYGNVLLSTGSIIPAFKEKLQRGENVQLMNRDMTRFLLTVDDAIQLIMDSLELQDSGKILVPRAKSCRVIDLAEILIEVFGNKDTKLIETELRPLEKIHEIFFSQEEIARVQRLDNKFVIHPMNVGAKFKDVTKEFSSGDEENLMSKDQLRLFLARSGALV
jgi:UDP-N-acetylglucosamine 4,6-dehydratase